MERRSDPADGEFWELVAQQHGVVSRRQLVGRGLSREAIAHRLRTRRLHEVHRGVYAVGRPQLGRSGRWLAAVLACGEGALLSFRSAAALWGVEAEARFTEVTIARPLRHRVPGVLAHRPVQLEDSDATVRNGIPLTSPIRTLIDLAAVLSPSRVERAVNRSDNLGLVDPVTLRKALDAGRRARGLAPLRAVLDHPAFALTDSELERRFLALVRKARLPKPKTGTRLNGFKVDFFWPELGLVVETDGLRYHRTPATQTRDARRDQAHTAAGLTTLRFTHSQVRHDAHQVAATLTRVIRRLSTTPPRVS